ncbi:MAG: hypothetical protein ACRDPY_17890 [Streptosporangiaceae bacterium]
MTTATAPTATPQASPARQGRQDLHWDADALPDGQMLAAAAARLLGRLSALAAQGDGRPGPVSDPGADKAAALTLIKAAHQLLCAATGRPTPRPRGAR